MENFSKDDPVNQKGFIRGGQRKPRVFSDNDLRFIRDTLLQIQQGVSKDIDEKISILVDEISNILEEGELLLT